MLPVRAVSMMPGMRCTRMEMRRVLVLSRGSRLVARCGQEPGDFRSGNRRAEQETLHLGAAELAQEFALPFLLHAFRCCGHVAGGGDVDHRLDNRRGRALIADVLHKGAVDLDLVEGETVPMAQRGIAGAETVERDL